MNSVYNIEYKLNNMPIRVTDESVYHYRGAWWLSGKFSALC